MLSRAAFAAVTTMTTTAVGAAASPFNQYAWVSEFAPMAIGVIMCVIVRALIDMETKKKKAWKYNVLVMLLCSIFTAVWVHEHALTAGAAMGLGMAAGAAGVGIISFGKPFLAFVLAKAQEGLKTPPAP